MRIITQLSLLASLGVAASDVHPRTKAAPKCTSPASTLSLTDLPYHNYFYSDCNVAAQAVVTTPQPDSDLSIIGPRLIVAWPAGDSGACMFFEPHSSANGTLAIELVNSTIGTPLGPVYSAPKSPSKYPSVGIQGVLRLNTTATLNLSILGSIRTIRDFVEGPSLLHPEFQDTLRFTSDNTGVSLQRTWLDNVTTTNLKFKPFGNSSSKNNGQVKLANKTITFEAGDYILSADINYPQLTALEPKSVLNAASANLTTEKPAQTAALSFLSYSEKVMAGAWRFFTYFGRDSMISALLLEPVLSDGKGSAMEAVIGAVLERVNRTDGTVCHEETIGDYATWINAQKNINSTAMGCDYKMVDTDYFLPVLMERYLVQNPAGKNRSSAFLNTTAGSINPANANLTWGDLALISSERVMRLARPFFLNQTRANLIRLNEGEVVGEWRDSTYGLGGGRIPYDVNTALVPAALRAIGTLARSGLYTKQRHWSTLADKYAKVWEDSTLSFFAVEIPKEKAHSLVKSFANASFPGPDQASSIDDDVHFHAVALEGGNNLSKVEVMNTDDCFRHFLLNTTTDAQLTPFLNQSANNIKRTFPAGLMTDAGMIVANPAFGEDPIYAKNFTTGAYHGTVIWSWQLAMMAKGLERQLDRCEVESNFSITSRIRGHQGAHIQPVPAFCTDDYVYDNVKEAYNTLWDSIEANADQLSGEVWSWVYRDGKFVTTPLGVLPAPPGVGGQTESNIRQLWSLTFLAVNRNEVYR
ncbi:unnamed protein product [Penicillium salamii]|nr:unnamed protein product [Penicillium salamii]CAG8042983.1 unnamed protein product [Penicillium salamii]CAG8344425.1 unnamed protein product [Penicillium salamii]CAG8344561.1 unnamed protein product [Penicillium salamii]CAG8398599.1 unnamed protein product [Penicillium salamii]